MDSEDDFTFCQVPPLDNRNGLEPKNLASHVGSITLKEKSSNSPSDDQSSGVLWKDKSVINLVPKEEPLGSLSFNVIDASSSKIPNEPTKQTSSTDLKASTNNEEVPKASIRKPATRAKVPFEKGYSQMDWMKLTRTHPDLAGLKGQSNKRLISKDEVKKHQSEGSMWTILKGQVYNIAPYMKFHPGGVDFLMKAVGKDCTSLFNKYHAWVNAEFLLEKCLVGKLDDGQ